jgi:hypothetical protein
MECVNAVKEGLRRIMAIVVSTLSPFGKEQGPREEL